MKRRNFLCNVTAGASIATASAATSKETASVDWKVNGFTCITCAVGLEVMLKGMPGVARARATYPENTVSIGFDSKPISERKLRDFIAVCGFRVA